MLAGIKTAPSAEVLVSLEDGDDAGVVRLNDQQALVQTVDLITPPVDDAYLFGKIAATNALSDVYAMGAKPISALNIVGFPEGTLPQQMLGDLLRGALDQLHIADTYLVGGHSLQDQEPKFGLAVNGLVAPLKIWRNRGAKPPDALLLTKPLGCGVLLNAVRAKRLSMSAIESCLTAMQTLNRGATEVLGAFSVNACTDVSGFGLACHALEMAKASQVCFELSLSKIPLFPHTLAAMEQGIDTKATSSNQAFADPYLSWSSPPPQPLGNIIFDPQTSGGLLVALPQSQASSALNALKKAGITASQIGTVQSLAQDQPQRFLICQT